MQTRLPKNVKDTHWGSTADQILRSCVHCGFCTATCPTYQLLGDELDGPRGRIYLIKQFFEEGLASRKTQQHLDRCLTCRSRETTCPSGVKYAQLLDIGREQLERSLPRPLLERIKRFALRKVFTSPSLFGFLITSAQLVKLILPASLKRQLPDKQSELVSQQKHLRKMLLLQGCVQSELAPEINASTTRILNQFGIELIETPGCCGALEHHLSATDDALSRIKYNIDHWYTLIENDVEAIISTASGCGVMIKDYEVLLADEPGYLEKAKIISDKTKDVSEIIRDEIAKSSVSVHNKNKIAFHSPCTLQHGQQLNGIVEDILKQLGFSLTKITDPHLCCGSAGTYSLLQKKLSHQLRDNKLTNLLQDEPQIIATANIGCLLHLRSGTDTPVMHWINLLDQQLVVSN